MLQHTVNAVDPIASGGVSEVVGRRAQRPPLHRTANLLVNRPRVVVRTIRDLLPGDPHPDEEYSTFQAALAPTDWLTYLDPNPNPLFTARMPGDNVDDHPLAHTGSNPFPGSSLQELLRLIKTGTLDMETDRKVRRHIDQRLKLLGGGEFLRWGHAPLFPTEQQYADITTISPIGGLHRVDAFDLGDFRWGDHKR